MTTRRRSRAVSVGSVALVAASLSGCGVGGSDQSAVCIDRTSDVRVADDECDDQGTGTGGAYGWYYIPAGRQAPAEGVRVSGQGSTVVPADDTYTRGGVSPNGETVSRGGFSTGKNGSFGG